MPKRSRLTKGSKSRKERLKSIITSKEWSDFTDVVKRAKDRGYSLDKFKQSMKKLRTDAQLQWMMLPITSPESASLKRDMAKIDRLVVFAEETW